ncbi:hypothetical protein [uncultured Sphingomonas sp.]|uniref:hypothetical protein n=1 Tax=uncultured Sphingomonas sp. TaxID=158754 RepID=UPI0035CB87D7
MLVAVVMLLSWQDYSLPPAIRSEQGDCAGDRVRRCAQARYRLDSTVDRAPDAKDRAMAENGRKCNVVGDKFCLSGRRTIWRSGENPVETLRTSFGLDR